MSAKEREEPSPKAPAAKSAPAKAAAPEAAAPPDQAPDRAPEDPAAATLAGKRGKNTRSDKLVVVGIGSSAGGLEALRQLLPNLPSSPTLAYVVVQHSDPKHRSMLASLLSSNTAMKVMEFTNGQKINPGTIYITPAGTDVSVINGKLFLRKTAIQAGPKPSIDIFFTTLAQDFGERAVGIILSGTGSDGAHGMRAIKAAGGITLVEDPAAAKYDGIARAAIQTGSVDLVLAPEKIGPELAYILSSPLIARQAKPTEPSADRFERLVTMINATTGIDYSDYKPNTMQRRLARRMALHKMSDLNQYLDYVRLHPEELTALSKDILISVTSFFRDEEAFKILKDVIAKIVAAKQPGESIRIWTPGCATGEEAYSVALLFAQHLGENFDSHNLQIFATDVDGDAIAGARRGEYPEASLANLDPELVARYFRREGSTLQVIKSLREHIVFARQDLVKDPPFSRLDLITCRNLMIYLNAGLQQRLLPLFHYALRPGGYLFLGKSESISSHHELFEPISKRWRIFQRKGAVRAQMPLMPKRHRPPQATVTAAVRKAEISLKDLTNQMVADIFGHAAVLIDERQEVLFVRGNVSGFLRVPEGVAEWNIVDLAQDALRGSLRASIHKASREQTQVTSPRIRLQGETGAASLILHVIPVNQEGAPPGLMLVVFDQTEGQDPLASAAGQEADWRDMRVAELDQELTATREHLQTITEELETSNEELQSLNEELQSANEELQSANEELETSNEELQATNDELTTVNEELQVKSTELSATYSDLENVLRRMSVAMVLVDRNHRVKRFTPPATAIFNIMSGDRGQVLTSLPSHLDLPNLRAALAGAIEEGKTVSQTITAGNRIYEMAVYPYYSQEECISGAILTFYDNTAILLRQQEFAALVENSPDIVARFDRQFRHLYLNPAVTRTTGLQPEWFIGKSNRELGMPPELCQQWEDAMRRVFTSGEEVSVRFKFPSPQGEIDIETRLAPEFTPAGEVGTILSVGRDVTRLTCAEQRAQESAEQLRHLLGSINDGFFALDQDLVVTYFNSAAGRLLGTDPAAAIGKPWLQTFPQLAGSVFETRFRQALSQGQPQEFETYFAEQPYQDWYHVRVFPFSAGISVYFQIVTDRKQAEEQLKEFNREITVQNRISEIFATAPDEEMYARILEFVQETLQSEFGTFGYFQADGSFVVPATTRGIYWEKCNVPEKNIIFQKGCFSGTWRQALDARSTIIANQGPFHTPPGHVAIENTIVTPIYYRGELLSALHLANKPGGYSERDRAMLEAMANHIAPVLHARLVRQAEERERKRAEARTDSLARFPGENPHPVLRLGADRTLLYYNPPAEKLLMLPGFDPDQPTLAPQRLWELAANAFASRKMEVTEARFGEQHFSLTLAPVAGKDYLNVYGTDITDRKHAEDARNLLEAQLRHAQKMESLGTLAGGIAHEFNNLLAAILGYAQLAQDAAQDHQGLLADLAQIVRASERGRDLVRQILTFSRKTEPELRPIYLNAAVRQDLDMLRRLLPKMVKISTDLAADLKIVRIAPNHVSQILTNLASNAAHAMPHGGQLTIKTANVFHPGSVCPICGERMYGDFVLLSVRDTGHGMDPETLGRIFEPFFSTKAIGSGTGLGLSVLHGLVKSYAGHIHCHSEAGQGATFEIYLPMYLDDYPAAPAGAPAGDPASQDLPGGSETILLVDDEEPLRIMGSRVLGGVGYRVLTAASGDEALAIYREKAANVDLVILDIGMPGTGGNQCLEQMLKINPQAKVIMASGYISGQQENQSLHAGAAAYLAKPLRKAQLLTTVRQILDGKPV
ncbi:MAG: chemotaxis protein CheB [Pseudomonadota bacterium]